MNQAVFDCKQCGYTQAVDPVHIGTVFSCPTCSAVVMVTAVAPPEPEQPPQVSQQAAAQANATIQAPQAAQYTAQQTQQAAQYAAQQAQQAQQTAENATQQDQQALQQTAQQTQQHIQHGHNQNQMAAQQAAQATANVNYGEQTAEAAPYAQNAAYAGHHDVSAQQHYSQHMPPQQQGFDPAMVAYQTGAVNSPVGVSVAQSHITGGTVEPVAQPFESPGTPPLNVPVPDARRGGSVFGNVLLFAILYILFMAPYLLPYLKNFGITDLSLLESGSVMSPFVLLLVCSTCLVIIALFRGLAIGKAWLFIFPVLAGAISFMPSLNLPSFSAPTLHVLTLALGVLFSPRRSRRLTF